MSGKLRILKMLEEGKINAQEAMKLLEAVGEKQNNEVIEGESFQKVEEEKGVLKFKDEEFFKIPRNNGAMKMLYIRIKASDGDNVKVTIPLDFVRIMINSKGSLGGNLEKHNIDIHGILQAIDEGKIGTLVQVETDEGDKILIEIA